MTSPLRLQWGMVQQWIFWGVMTLLAAKLAVQLTLEALNRRAALAQKDRLPDNLQGIVTPQAHARSAEYTLEHNALSMLETAVAALVKVAILVVGLVPLVSKWTVGQWGGDHVWAQAAVMCLLSLAVGVLFWPFEWYSTFGIEAKYGFNRQTFALWASDQLKSWALTLVLTVPLTAALLWMAGGVMHQWWLWAFMVVMTYEIVLTFLYPNFIEPLFNKFEPLKDGPLKTRLEALAQRAHVNVSKILVMDAGKRSAHGNAYFAGIGASRRIVLYDTLLQQLSDEEVEAVLAHEIGHLKHQHTLRGVYVAGAWQLLGFFALDKILHWPEFYWAFGLSQSWGPMGIFLLLSLIGGAFSFWFIPLMSNWHRLHEYQADAYAVKLVGVATPLIGGLKKLTKESLASIEEHPLSQAFYASHPTLRERENKMKNS